MDEYWDREEHWLSEHRCAICKTVQISPDDYVCSSTCSDILTIREQSCVA